MEFKCLQCNKNRIYKSYQSLWNHTNKFHKKNKQEIIQNNPEVIQINPKVIQSNPKVNEKPLENIINYKCKFCIKSYKYKQGKWKHEQTCKNKNKIITENEELKKEINEINEIKKQLYKKSLIFYIIIEFNRKTKFFY
jgi:hypothetical protein